MATKTNNETGNKKEFTLEQVFAMWLHKSKNGSQYLSGKDGDVQLVGFINGKKKNPKEPDIRIYTRDSEGEISEKEYLSLWVKVSKSEKKYLSGRLGEKWVTGFFNSKAEPDGKIPYISVYYSDDSKTEFAQPDTKTELPF